MFTTPARMTCIDFEERAREIVSLSRSHLEQVAQISRIKILSLLLLLFERDVFVQFRLTR